MHSHPRDRSLRLKISGALVLLCGLLLASLGALQIAVVLLGLAPVAIDRATLATGVLSYGLIGGAFAIVGLGSLRLRRWALPMMQTLCWTWLLLGLTTMLLLWSLLESLLALSPASSGAAPEILRTMKLMVWLVVFVGGVATPAWVIWIYRSPDVRWTLEQHDRHPSWVDRCPPPVLGLAVALAASGAIALPTAFRPALPVFGQIWSGTAGTLLTLIGAAACLWLARELYRLRWSGWWGTAILLTSIGLSTSWTLEWGDTQQLLLAAGYPQDFVMPKSFSRLGALLSLAITVATGLYMLRLRPHFERATVQDSTTHTPSR